MIAVVILFHAENEKNRMKTILKKDSNTRQIQDIVPVSNLKARKIKTLLSLPIHLTHHRIAAAAVAPLSLRSADDAVPPAVTPAVAPAISPDFTPMSFLLSLFCRSAVTPLLLCYCSVISPL